MDTLPPPRTHIHAAITTALQEDIALGDVTTSTLLPPDCQAQATIVANQDLTLAGVAIAREIFHLIDPTIRLTVHHQDGDRLAAQSRILTVLGAASSLFLAERVTLNFLQHLSGIATLTAQFCQAVEGYPVLILDTRKTIPGLRSLEKWAVRLGGGTNHRQSLGDGLLIKDNHLTMLGTLGITLAQACRKAKTQGPHGLRVAVEVESLDHVTQALEAKADVLLLDNMDLNLLKQAIALINDRAFIEASGGITLDSVREIAKAGVHGISIGALTHSAPAVDLSMDFHPPPLKPLSADQ